MPGAFRAAKKLLGVALTASLGSRVVGLVDKWQLLKESSLYRLDNRSQALGPMRPMEWALLQLC